MLPENNSELLSLRLLSAEIGADPLLVQGPGGNTSMKIGEVLWVKASGKSLKASASEGIFIPVNYMGVRAKLLEGATDPLDGQTITKLVSSTLRPSIETSLHAIMADPIVVHVHCVKTIGWSVAQNVEMTLSDVLQGEEWGWIPYRRPGVPLAEEILERKLESARILVLGNHGLVVTGDEPQKVAQLLKQIVKRLDRKPRRLSDTNIKFKDLQNFCADTAYCLPIKTQWHSLGVDTANLDIVSGGSLYPDHVIFLGPGVTMCPSAGQIKKYQPEKESPKLLVVPQSGILVLKGLSQVEKEMIQCLVDVVCRVPASQKIRYLTQSEEKDLLDWDAEQYRISLNAYPTSNI